MNRYSRSVRPYITSLLALLVAAAACDSGAKSAAAVTSDTPSSAETLAARAYSADDEGNGTLWVDGTQVDNLTGSCDISRQNGKEDLGDLSNREGLKMVAGIGHSEPQPGPEMSFKVYSDSVFALRVLPGSDEQGTLTQVALVGTPTPKGKSTMLGLVSFTGTSAKGQAIVAHVVCELQNKFN